MIIAALCTDRRALVGGGLAWLLSALAADAQGAPLTAEKLKRLIQRALAEPDTTPFSRPHIIGFTEDSLTTRSLEFINKTTSDRHGFMVVIHYFDIDACALTWSDRARRLCSLPRTAPRLMLDFAARIVCSDCTGLKSMAVTPLRRDETPPSGSGLAARLAIRADKHRGPTAGLAPGFVQGNLAILPQRLAADFLRFCQLNPKSCPLIGMSAPGDWRVPALAEDLDIRTDLPRYRVWRNGELAAEPADVREFWRDDLVSFVIGCSFSFEEALTADGIELRHITQRCNVPMYRTSIATAEAGPFHGPMVVSMRPMTPANAIRAIQITTRFPAVHGAPVHVGKPELIGIKDIAKPDYGDAVDVRDDELPVFWACGVTPQSVIATVKPEFCITHYPGSMLVTDRKNTEFAIM